MPTGGIRTHNLSRRTAVDPRLRPRGHWDRLLCKWEEEIYQECCVLEGHVKLYPVFASRSQFSRTAVRSDVTGQPLVRTGRLKCDVTRAETKFRLSR